MRQRDNQQKDMPVTFRGQNDYGVDGQRQRRPSPAKIYRNQHFTPSSGGGVGCGYHEGSGGGDARMISGFYYVDPFSRPGYFKFLEFYI